MTKKLNDNWLELPLEGHLELIPVELLTIQEQAIRIANVSHQMLLK